MRSPLIAVLAGGASRRMGRDKPFVRVAGRRMADWVLEAAESVGEVLVVGRLGTFLDRPAAVDIVGGRRGPGAGLATALARARGPVVLVAADQPWLRPTTLRALVERFDGRAVVPREDGHFQVTCAIYPPSLARPMTHAARLGRSIRSVLETHEVDLVDDWASWGEDGRSWYSVDTEDAIEHGLAAFGLPGVG